MLAGAGHYLQGNRPGRHSFLEELYVKRKHRQPKSSIRFAVMEEAGHKVFSDPELALGVLQGTVSDVV